MIYSSLKTFCDNVYAYKQEKQERLTIAVQATDEVSYGFDKGCDIDYCIQNNIPVFDRNGAGGTIVHAKGNISFDYIYSHDKIATFVSLDFLNDLADYLKEKGLSVEVANNDILVDGYKVASCAEDNLPPDFRWCNSIVQISINQNMELIQRVCLKPMVKVPKGLGDYGITTDEMLKFVCTWFNEKGLGTV